MLQAAMVHPLTQEGLPLCPGGMVHCTETRDYKTVSVRTCYCQFPKSAQSLTPLQGHIPCPLVTLGHPSSKKLLFARDTDCYRKPPLAKTQRLIDGGVPMFNIHLQSLHSTLKETSQEWASQHIIVRRPRQDGWAAAGILPLFFFKEKYKKGEGIESGRSWDEEWM